MSLGVDFLALMFATAFAIQLVAGRQPTGAEFVVAALIHVFVLFPTGVLTGYYRAVIRFLSLDLLLVVTRVVSLYALILFAAASTHYGYSVSWRLVSVYSLVAAIWLVGSRFGARQLINKRARHRERVIIYGAGSGGVRLAKSLAFSPRFLPVAFVDDQVSNVGRSIENLRVYPARNVAEVAEKTHASRIFLAMPSASRRQRRRILDHLEPLKLRVQTIPDIGDIIASEARVDDVREVAVEDLLGRDPVPPKLDLLQKQNANKVVLVTGAGGSIGSELCRQVLEIKPRKLLLFEQSEHALYSIERELRMKCAESGLSTRIIAFLGSVGDKARMLEVLTTFDVETVYHAAAYKHVPMVEHNAFSGIDNNVFGTESAAEAAIEAGVSTFVLISTDKAVSPTNIMGASKRLAEMILQRASRRSPRTRFCMVRFGNVLASSGSVVPLFREQIRKGGPVTVTHPEITRYFMTIPEAAQLVVQAAALAEGGDVFVLDMGQPVKIVDLARKLIHLSGLTVHNSDGEEGDIEIVFTGLRPAEKLYEELLIGSNVSGTEHPRILRANEQSPSDGDLSRSLAELRTAIDERDHDKLRAVLSSTVEGYGPSDGIQDYVWNERRLSANQKVTDLKEYRKQ
ncbi:MAG: nucleoside-diphosphate sugar epimerase/dehydratase [Pseudomonadota bacterium]